MGRPKKQQDELRSDTLAFRLTPAERVRIEQAARSAGINASEYARLQALKGRVVIRQSYSLDHAIFDQLRRIGVNLNQLTRLAHVTQELPVALPRALAALEAFLESALSGPSPPPGPGDPDDPDPGAGQEAAEGAGITGAKPGLDHGP